jgi:hypothetical protein|tara:strand:- start:774 stop:1115 length:342 start_codon:yes stop_codon:yes gene_type:complete
VLILQPKEKIMVLENNKTYKKGEEEFEKVLDLLERKFFHNGGDDEAEVIINWNKREVKEEGVICMYAANSVVSNAIKRCRKGIVKVDTLPVGTNLYFDKKCVRPLHTVLKVMK